MTHSRCPIAAILLATAIAPAFAQAPGAGLGTYRTPAWSCPQQPAKAPASEADRARIRSDLADFHKCREAYGEAVVAARRNRAGLMKSQAYQDLSVEQRSAWMDKVERDASAQSERAEAQLRAMEKAAALYLETWSAPPTDAGVAPADFAADMDNLRKTVTYQCARLAVVEQLRTSEEVAGLQKCLGETRTSHVVPWQIVSRGRWFWFGPEQQARYAAALKDLRKARTDAAKAEFVRVNAGLERQGAKQRLVDPYGRPSP